MIITDLNLKVVDDRQCVIWDSPVYDQFWEHVAFNVREMHGKSGLLNECNQFGMHPDAAMEHFYEWLEGHGVKSETEEPMVGSSVQFDRSFLDTNWPAVSNRFNYRNIDISSIKELCKRFNPSVYAKLDEHTSPKKLHRVLPDLHDSIAEFKFYLENFLFEARPV